MKIGIVLNYKKAEKKKDELLNINSRKMSWLSLAKDEKYKKHVISIVKKDVKREYIAADVAIGIYIESHFKNVLVDYITPPEISTRRFKQNDLIFIIIYDLLEAFHLSDTEIFYTFKNALKNSNNVYPPYQYQKFINNKCYYYKYLSERGIHVAPTFCITKEKWYSKSPQKYVTNLLTKVKAKKWNSIIAKPVYGQEAIGFEKFIDCQQEEIKLSKYLSKNIPKYKSIVIQEYIPGFDKNSPEFRMYFINGIFSYCIITSNLFVSAQPIEIGGTFKLKPGEWDYLLRFSQKVMNSLPKLELKGKHANPILTRIDIGSGLVNQKVPFGFFVNEVEFVPSLYIENHSYPVIEEIAKSIVKVTTEYEKNKLDHINVLF